LNTLTSIDVHSLIADRPLGRVQRLVLLLGFCVIAMEGFDMAVMSFIVPVLKQQWHIESRALAPALSGAQVGLIVGALIAGPLADRYGRKTVLIASVALFGLATMLTATVETLPWLIFLRFLTGVGVGSVVPNTATLVSEYSPSRIRSLSVSFIICGVSFSSACAGFMSAWIIPAYGWRWLLILGGALPLLMLPVLQIVLPESVRFLVASDAPSARIRAVVERIAPGTTSAESRFFAPAEGSGAGETKMLFTPRYRLGSQMLWLMYFAMLLASNMMSNWLPTLLKESGLSFRYAAEVTAVYQTGGVIGALVLGWSMDRRSAHKIPAIACLVGAAMFIGIGLVFHSKILVLLVASILGFSLIGAICSVNVLPTVFYPTCVRATGSCWMHGAGRCGALLSILAGAQLLAMHCDASHVLMILALPAAVAGVALLVKGRCAPNEVH
jgi:MFS transporter, AAHS family, 4-hydroxybenzoate transporter